MFYIEITEEELLKESKDQFVEYMEIKKSKNDPELLRQIIFRDIITENVNNSRAFWIDMRSRSLANRIIYQKQFKELLGMD